MRYPDPLANAFRHRAAEVLGVQPDWILCGNGSDDILTIVTRAFVGQGQRLRLPYPSYILYKTLAQLQGAVREEVRFRDDWTLPPEFAAAAADLRLVFLANPNSPSGTVVSARADPGTGRAAALPAAGRRGLRRFRRRELHGPGRAEREDHGLADAEQVVRPGRPAVRLPGGPAALDRATVKVKDSYNCDALSIAGATAAIDDQAWLRQNGPRSSPRGSGWLTEWRQALGFAVCRRRPTSSGAPIRSMPAVTIYEQLKQNRVLVRYMNYPGWGDGLRISVGTDEQIDALLALLKAMV